MNCRAKGAATRKKTLFGKNSVLIYLPAPSKLFLCVLQFGDGATTFWCPEEPNPGIELKRFSFLRCFAAMGSCAGLADGLADEKTDSCVVGEELPLCAEL